MIDCGLDWLGKLKRVGPCAIVLTHAHPDHAWGLKQGAPCPVYATEKTWQELRHYPIKDRHVIKERTATRVCGITVHSQTRQSVNRSFACSHATDMVPERRRAVRDHNTLRI